MIQLKGKGYQTEKNSKIQLHAIYKDTSRTSDTESLKIKGWKIYSMPILIKRCLY